MASDGIARERKEKDKRQNIDGGTEMPNQPKTTQTEAESRPAPTDTNTGSSSSSRIIEFSENNLDDDGTEHVFSTWNVEAGEDPVKIAFRWTVTDDTVRLGKIELIKVNEPEDSIRHMDFSNDDRTKQPSTDSDPSDFFEDLNEEDGSVNMNFQAFRDDTQKLDYNDIYAVRMSWTREGDTRTGESISPYFAVTEGTNDSLAEELQQEILDTYKDKAETGTEDDPASNSSTLPGNSNPSGAYPSGTDAADADDHDSGSSSGGGGGLSPGAIAGIVVGVVVLLALIAGLIFFFLRRRRKAKAAGGYADAGHHDASNAYIVDKVDTSAQSPRSPYSDDGQEQHTPLDPQAHHDFRNQEPAAGEGSNGSEYAGLYQANQQTSRGVDEDDAQSPTRLQSRSNTGNYSHLVEEGMTEDDIRRLEDEERQLDDEIARAGRR